MKNLLTLCTLIVLSVLVSQCGPNPIVIDPNYEPNCSACHGKDLQGLALGPSLLAENLKHGNSVDAIARGIAEGYPDKGMPAFKETLSEEAIRNLAIWIGEKRANTSYADYRINKSLVISDSLISSEQYNFRLEVVADGLDPWPYSIEPLPDGRFLVTEKMKGLRLIEPDGTVSDLIEGTPKAYDDGGTDERGLMYGLGWMLDVAIHPNYEENGWIYMTFGDRCSDCNEESRASNLPVSLGKMVRGRIENGKWVDQETLWEGDKEAYTAILDLTIGGRITFDEQGHVFFSHGGKKYTPHPPGNYESYLGIQDLAQPYGKIYRLNEDGSIPADNPFVDSTGVLPAIWTYCHRSPQGLEYNPKTQLLWETEMGPRGGDEVNLLGAGKNYGWPLVSNGMNYNGTKVEYGKYLGIDVEELFIEQPKVDLTPSPAVSSFAIYQGDQFPGWQNNLIVGSLKAATLYRFVVEGTEVVQEEILLQDLARIRDIEVGNDGFIYLLLEHQSGGQIVRLVPE